MSRLLIASLTLALLGLPAASNASGSLLSPEQLTRGLQWRSIGPYIGGRVVAVAGVPSQPNVFYMGAVQGGIWKSTNYGLSWSNVSDGQLPSTANSIGALAVAPSNPRVVYAGTGEADIRQDFDSGDGIYRSADAGKAWKYAGLRETRQTSALVVDPRDPNVVYAASMGHVFKPNAERGIFKTADGGKTWRNVLYVNADTGGGGVVMDPRNPNVLYAAMWQAQRRPWGLTSGGPGSGLFKTVDGGAHWTNLSKTPGFPRGPLGKIGVAVAASDPRVVYAIVQAKDGGVFRSNDAGATWKHVNDQWKLRQRAFYYTAIFADPVDAMVAYAPQVDGVFKSTDGGTTWKTIATWGDHHVVWVNPLHPNVLLQGNDGGAAVSVDGGRTWSSETNQPTGQYYHVALDDEFPFHVYGAAQDEGAFSGPSASANGQITAAEWHAVALGESTFVAPEPGNPNVTYGAGYFSTLGRLDSSVGQLQNVTPWSRYMSGAQSSEQKYRFGWTHPIFFSPADPNELLVAAQVVFSSTDRGKSWKILSPDLTRNDPRTEGPSGGPIDYDQTGAEIFPDISSLAVSPHNANVMWAGSADGLVHVTTDHGAHWADVTPPALPQWSEIGSIEPSHASETTAYLSASRYQWDDYHPYVYKTTDLGAHWTAMATGIPQDQYVFTVREDPREPRLLFAGTRSNVYASYDGGALWQRLSLNLPGAQVRDVAVSVREGELVAATHGRAFWILDDVAPLEQIARNGAGAAGEARLFAPETVWLTHAYGAAAAAVAADNAGENHAFGARIFFYLPPSFDGKTPLALSFLDAKGSTVRSFTLHLKGEHVKAVSDEERERYDAIHDDALEMQEATAVRPGMNLFQWDLRYPPATDVPGFIVMTTDDFPDSSRGPSIVPGAYSVVLQYGATKLVQPIDVRLDPRLRPAAADLDARLALGMQIHDTIDALDKAVLAARAARLRLPAGKRAVLDSTLASLIVLDYRSSEADSLKETKVREQLGFLANAIESAYERPTAAQYENFAELRAEATAGIAKLNAFTSSRP